MTIAEIIAAKVLASLTERVGFNQLWEDIDSGIKSEIVSDVSNTVQLVMDGYKSLNESEKLYTLESLSKPKN